MAIQPQQPGTGATPSRETWGSRFGFIMATAGFAIGLGNIWRFPYTTGTNGGGAFVLIYVVMVVLIGIPLFTAEISLGRKSQLSSIAGMRKLTGRKGSPWNLIGWLGVGTAFIISSYYNVIIAWVVAYLVYVPMGRFEGLAPAAVAVEFSSLAADPGRVLLFTLVVYGLLWLIVQRGLQRGVERAAKVLMPVLLGFFVVLAVGGLFLDGAMEGIRWYLAPDFSEVTAATFLAALGQAFYSIGVGLLGAFVFGSFMHPSDSDVPGSAVTVVAVDTGVALLAGLVIFPPLFAFGLEPNAGPGLLFVTMTNVFAMAPGGQAVGGVFFFLVLIAALTSSIALMEALTSTLMDMTGMKRRNALALVLAGVFVFGVPSMLAFGPWADLQLFGRNFFDLANDFSGNVLLTTGGLLIALYTAYVWGFARFQEETNVGVTGRIRVFDSWRPVMRYVIPPAVAIVLLSGLGLLG